MTIPNVTVGGVIAERVNTANLLHKVNPIFGRSLVVLLLIIFTPAIIYCQPTFYTAKCQLGLLFSTNEQD